MELVGRQYSILMSVEEARAYGIELPAVVVGQVKITMDEDEYARFSSLYNVTVPPDEVDGSMSIQDAAALVGEFDAMTDLISFVTKLIPRDEKFSLTTMSGVDLDLLVGMIQQIVFDPDLTAREADFRSLCVAMQKAIVRSDDGAAFEVSESMKAMLYPGYEPVAPDPYANEPYLYILMRDDMDSLNPGKAVAQGTHAANQMVWEVVFGAPGGPAPMAENLRKFADGLDNDTLSPVQVAVVKWMFAAGGFGTCIVKSVDGDTMAKVVEKAKAEGSDIVANVTHDPSYPIKDGKVFFTRPVDTCAFVFGLKKDCVAFVAEYPLMR